MALYGSELSIDESGLALYGENVARLLRITGKTRCSALAKPLSDDMSSLQKRYEELGAIYGGNRGTPPVAEWLLDNFMLARCEGLKAADELKQSAKLDCEKGTPALFWLCLCLVRCGNGKVTTERCRLFFQGCQTVYVLNAKELSLFVSMLRTALISELAALYGEGTLTDESAVSAERLFTSLRLVSTFDFSELLQEIDKVEQLYRLDPAGVYPLMAEKTRAYYKEQTARLAKIRRVNELRVAERVLFLSRGVHDERQHMGYWLFARPLGRKPYAANGTVYIIFNILLTLLVSFFIASGFDLPFLFLLLVFPISEIVKFLIDLIMLSLLPPAHVPRMELENGVPQDGRTLCIISALMTNETSGPKLARRLEEYRLANRGAGENLLFGILGDLPDADDETAENDQGVISSAKEAIDALNEKYGGGFFFLIRPRKYNDRDLKYMAHERKRGAITELARLLCERDSSVDCAAGSVLALRGVRYILTLDEDTRLVPDSALEFIGAMLHPLNKPVMDRRSRKIVSGHAIIQPRMGTELACVAKSAFSRVFAGQGGADPYGCDCSELYMDAFKNGGFSGKGIIDAQAFLACLDDRIPENAVLSHDALEGGFLRGGLMSDLELLDSYPSDISSYYKRMHRWTRGDWQNLPWLFSRGRALSHIDKFRLFDSVRRSLLPPAYFVAFALAFFMPVSGAGTVALTALFTICLRLLQAIIQNLFVDVSSSRQRLRSRLIRGVNESLLRVLIYLMLLPYEAYVCLTAAVTALWRMLITHRNMLNWTPASVFDSKGQSAQKYYGTMWFAPVAGLAILLLAPSVIGKTAGLIWLFTPAMALSLSRPTKHRASELSPEDKRYLLSSAAKIWAFFEEFCSPVDHFLPPDNFQERPPVGIAHRSSPTNIGLCLLSCLAAIDLGITRRETALGIIENVLATCRRLPKWNGHLYNWYDTRSLKPLHPAYVSTVDSGNLAVCLIILREGLLELELPLLAQQCEDLLTPMSFEPLYDKKRRLFSIGVDTDKGGISKSYYDLLASEARTSSFIAIARGDVPRKHWRSLSRAQVKSGQRRGMVSWTGSSFEYLMPRLFFKHLPGSMLYETDRFCVDVQKQRCKKRGLPWGISESAYYSLDSSLNYRYKAHGCATLALKRGMDKELVVSPYSSFLALPCGAKSAIENLHELDLIAPQEKYGFWDAVDFSSHRTDGEKGEIVRCAMAHHLGMSIVAIANCLCCDTMPRRLMRDPAMSAYSCLLEEKLPLGGLVLRRREAKTPEKPPRAGSIFWEKRGDFTDFSAPECCALSNGSYNLMLTDSGSSFPRWKGIIPYFTPEETPAESHGLDLWLLRGGDLVSLLPDPSAGESCKNQWEFNLSGARFSTVRKDIRCQTTIAVSAENIGERRKIAVSPIADMQETCKLIVGFRPVLASYYDYVNHPAFYGLGLEAYELDGTLMIHRLRRNESPECYLCLACSGQAEFSARRDLVPGRGGMAAAVEQNLPGELGALNDPYVCASIELRLAPGTDSAVSIALAVSSDEKGAFDAAHRILIETEVRAADFTASYAKSMGMNEKQLELALELLKTITYPAPRTVNVPVSELWRFGVSGDLPIVTECINSSDDLDKAASMVLAHNLLCALERPFALVFITDEGGDYMRPLAGSIENLRRGPGGGSSLIYAADRSQDLEALTAYSVSGRERPISGRSLQYLMPADKLAPVQDYPDLNWSEDLSFSFDIAKSLPPRAWGNMLSNGHFGFFATDCGTGHMWFENAREYHINRWLCDAQTTVGTEQLTLGGKTVFADAQDDCRVTYGFGFARWEKELGSTLITTEGFVPEDTNARVFIITWEGGSLPMTWFTDLVMGGAAMPGRGLSVELDDGMITSRNIDSPYPDFPFRVCANTSFGTPCTLREKWLRGDRHADCNAVDSLGISCEVTSPFILVCGCDEPEKLRELCDYERAASLLKSTQEFWSSSVSRIKVNTPLPSLDRLINGWLPYQTLACRLRGRCSIYQSGGATGFRDQLQDAVSLILLDPALARKQILECCRHQYEQGDVMHWWHRLQSEVRGVRTRCSDDLLWLPWALCEYIEKTGDESMGGTLIPWLSSPPLKDGEHDRYERAVYSDSSDSVLEHCKRALEIICFRGAGAHGLLKIGGGDWNDGMNLVGGDGMGESVWLSWFFSHTAHRFAELLRRAEEDSAAESLEIKAAEIGRHANLAWDGQWFLRGYYDDGSPLGSESQKHCRIDSIAQSFASLCPEADKERVNQGLTSASQRLFDHENRIIKLFEPPFENSDPYPGYIESYGAGFRENGGQYTHAAVWLMMAMLRENRLDEALELISALIPEDKPGVIYEAEPYVLAADIYSNPACVGMAGWSWYTGAAGWFWRVITEELFGIRMNKGIVSVRPNLPDAWASLPLSIEMDGKTIWQQNSKDANN